MRTSVTVTLAAWAFGRWHAFKAAQQFFFGHLLESVFCRVDRAHIARLGNQWHFCLFGLINLNMLLHGVNEFFTQIVLVDGFSRNFAQRHYRVFIAVAFNSERSALRNKTGPVGCKQNQLKAVRQFVNAVFDGDARHEVNTPAKGVGLGRLLAINQGESKHEVTAMQYDRPNTIPWPPIIYITAAVIGVVAQRFWSLPWVGGNLGLVTQVLGAALAIAALSLDVATFATFRKHKTTVMPNKAATNLITTGPFAWSRNPIYVANTVLVMGAGLYFGNVWLAGLAFVAAFLTQKLAIEREEKHLAAKFGDAWQGYAKRVRRWL